MSEEPNGHNLEILKAAATKPVYRELNLSDFDESKTGKLSIRVSITHAEDEVMRRIARRRSEILAQLAELPDTPENRGARQALQDEDSETMTEWLVLMANFAGLSREQSLDFFRGNNPNQNPDFEIWVSAATARLIREFRQQDFLAHKTPSEVGLIH